MSGSLQQGSGHGAYRMRCMFALTRACACARLALGVPKGCVTSRLPPPSPRGGPLRTAESASAPQKQETSLT
eukprot:355515-Chlamydomonas_euryale.AAC.7